MQYVENCHLMDKLPTNKAGKREERTIKKRIESSFFLLQMLWRNAAVAPLNLPSPKTHKVNEVQGLAFRG